MRRVLALPSTRPPVPRTPAQSWNRRQDLAQRWTDRDATHHRRIAVVACEDSPRPLFEQVSWLSVAACDLPRSSPSHRHHHTAYHCSRKTQPGHPRQATKKEVLERAYDSDKDVHLARCQPPFSRDAESSER